MRNQAPLAKRWHPLMRSCTSGTYVHGEFVPAEKKLIKIFANIQPSFSFNHSQLLPEGDRSRQRIWGSSNQWVHTANSGESSLEPDYIRYMKCWWEVKAVMPYENGLDLKHVEFLAIKVDGETLQRLNGEVNEIRICNR